MGNDNRWKKTREEYRQASHLASSGRWMGEYAHELWNVAPIDMLSVADFEKMLVEKFGAEYLEPVRYAWQDGEFLPVPEVTL